VEFATAAAASASVITWRSFYCIPLPNPIALPNQVALDDTVPINLILSRACTNG
jgi:hypothetical protein